MFIDVKISILQIAEKLDSISEINKVAGFTLSSLYVSKKAYEQHGREGLAQHPKHKPHMPRMSARLRPPQRSST